MYEQQTNEQCSRDAKCTSRFLGVGTSSIDQPTLADLPWPTFPRERADNGSLATSARRDT
jgi:hypothetical protein